MGFNIIITGITNPRSTTVLAHHLAQQPGVTLQQARLKLTRLPQLYEENLSKQDIAQLVPKLRTMGVTLRLEEYLPPSPPEPPAQPGVHQPQPESTDPPPQPQPPAPVALHPVPASTAPPRMAIPPEPPRQHRRRRRGGQALAWFAGIGVVLGLFVLTRMGEQQRFAVRRMDPIRRKPAPAPQHLPPSARQGGAAHNDQTPPTREQHHEALALVDSALQSSADPGRAIRFYRMALSFNRYNVHAWYGLIEAYGEAGLHREAAQTRREMQEVLGQRSFSLASLVAPVGTAVSLTTTDLGTVRLEYRSRATDRGELLREVWQLSRSLGRDCNCRALSLHATTESGTGVLVHIDAQSVPGDLASFQSAASITFLE